MAEARKRQLGNLLLEVRDLTMERAGRRMFRKLSLKVRAGEIVGLAGPGGAGKTTFADCLSGLEEPGAGEIIFAGYNLFGHAVPAVGRVIRLVGRAFVLSTLLWLPLGLGVVCPTASFPLEAGLLFALLAGLRIGLVYPLTRFRPWSRRLLQAFVLADTFSAAFWLWRSGGFAAAAFFGLFPFYPLLVPGALGLLMVSPVLFFIVNLTSVREAFGWRPPPARITALGLARTFQEPRIWPRLSVLDNVIIARFCRARSRFPATLLGLPGARAETRDMHEKAAACLRFVGLGEQLESPAGALSQADRRRLEIARALATEPRLLLLDEPASGIDAAAVEELARLLQRISRAGIAVLLIENDLKPLMELADQIYVLDRGELVASGSPDQVRSDPRVVEIYLGARHGVAEA